MQKVMCVWDSKVGAFLPPQVFVTVGVAIRSFKFAANNEGSDFYRYASDYTLFEIGEWNDEKGEVLMHQNGKIGHGTALEHQEVLVEVPPVRMQADLPGTTAAQEKKSNER